MDNIARKSSYLVKRWRQLLGECYRSEAPITELMGLMDDLSHMEADLKAHLAALIEPPESYDPDAGLTRVDNKEVTHENARWRTL